jgi:hypothetical protein
MGAGAPLLPLPEPPLLPLPEPLLLKPPLLELVPPDPSTATSEPESEPVLLSELHATAYPTNPSTDSPSNHFDRSIFSVLRLPRKIRSITTTPGWKMTSDEPGVPSHDRTARGRLARSQTHQGRVLPEEDTPSAKRANDD